MAGQVRDLLPELPLDAAGCWTGTEHDVTDHVPTGTQGREKRRIDRLQGFFHVLFEHAVEFEILSIGDAQRSVGIARGNLLIRQVLRRSYRFFWLLGAPL